MDFSKYLVEKYGMPGTVLKLNTDDFQKELESFQREVFTYALRRAKGNKLRASQYIGCNRNTINNTIRRMGIDDKAIIEEMKKWKFY